MSRFESRPSRNTLKTDTAVTILSDDSRCANIAITSWPVISILRLGGIGDLIFSFCLIVVARKVCKEFCLRNTGML